jgi:hypothetical protein
MKEDMMFIRPLLEKQTDLNLAVFIADDSGDVLQQLIQQ